MRNCCSNKAYIIFFSFLFDFWLLPNFIVIIYAYLLLSRSCFKRNLVFERQEVDTKKKSALELFIIEFCQFIGIISFLSSIFASVTNSQFLVNRRKKRKKRETENERERQGETRKMRQGETRKTRERERHEKWERERHEKRETDRERNEKKRKKMNRHNKRVLKSSTTF